MYSRHAHSHHDKNSIYLVIAAIIAIILFFYYGLKFADRSYSRVLGTSQQQNRMVDDEALTEINEKKQDIYLFFFILLVSFITFTYAGYNFFVKRYNIPIKPKKRLKRK